MMPFFFTMPISRMMAMMPITLRSWPASLQRQQRAHARRGQGREDGQRVDEALIEHAQDDIDGDQRRGDQDRLVGQRLLEGLRGALERAGQASAARPASSRASSTALVAWLSATPGARLNDRVAAGNSPWWLMVRLLVRVGIDLHEQRQRHGLAGDRRQDIDRVEEVGRGLQARRRLDHDVVAFCWVKYCATSSWPIRS